MNTLRSITIFFSTLFTLASCRVEAIQTQTPLRLNDLATRLNFDTPEQVQNGIIEPYVPKDDNYHNFISTFLNYSKNSESCYAPVSDKEVITYINKCNLDAVYYDESRADDHPTTIPGILTLEAMRTGKLNILTAIAEKTKDDFLFKKIPCAIEDPYGLACRKIIPIKNLLTGYGDYGLSAKSIQEATYFTEKGLPDPSINSERNKKIVLQRLYAVQGWKTFDLAR